MKKEPKKVIMMCPYCGMKIGRITTLEQGEIKCPQCKTLLLINYKNSVLTVREAFAEYDAGHK